MGETAKWYAIHTYSGYEVMVKNTLEKLIENNNLGEQILDIRIPMYQDIVEGKNGKKKVVERKILPCYVFLKMVYSNDLWFMITNTRGVTGFVGPQGKAVPIGDDEVRKMRLEEKVEECDLAVGDEVVVISGPLASFTGVVEGLDETNQKAKVKVSMFGRETEVDLDFIQLDKIKGLYDA